MLVESGVFNRFKYPDPPYTQEISQRARDYFDHAYYM